MDNSGDYISREYCLKCMEDSYKNAGISAKDKAKMTRWLKNAPVMVFPAADVRPVVRGAWEWNKNNGFYYCSKCGAISPREDQDGEYCDCPNFCHNCGADMRQEVSDG